MGLIATPLAIDPVTSLIYLLTAVVALVAIPAAVVWMAPSNRLIWAMALAFGLGTAASTLYGLPGYVYRNYGFTYHPVALAYTCMLTLALVPFLLTMKVRYRWVVTPPIVVVALVGLWTSGSRTGLVVLILLVVMVPVMERSLRLGLAVAAAGVIALPTILTYDPTSGSTSALSRLFGSGGAQASDQTRISTIEDGLQQIQQNPLFGNGYSVEHTYVIHNLYLQVFAAEGVIGLVGICLMLAALVIPLRTATAPQRALCYPAAAAILAGPFQPNMADHYLGLTLGLSLFAAVGVMNRRREKEDPPDADERPASGSRSTSTRLLPEPFSST
ncbi:MAG: O-antigen ligase family protein, partial [Nocardioidaceae bacterium]|nr:O-antigen ligase family protein [Nocardioidaceae bacterium]